MEKVLLKDIVIPAGTVFSDAPTETRRAPGNFGETVIGLSKNTYGTLVYELNGDDADELAEWFADVRR